MYGIAYKCAHQEEQAIAETRVSMLVVTPSGERLTVSGQPDLVLAGRRHMIVYRTTRPTPYDASLPPEPDAKLTPELDHLT